VHNINRDFSDNHDGNIFVVIRAATGASAYVCHWNVESRQLVL